MNNRLLSQNLKYLRKQVPLTQDDMAQRLELKKSSYASYEAEEGNTPPSRTLYQIAKILDVSMEGLFEIDYSLLGGSKPVKITDQEIYFPVSVDPTGTELIDIVPSTYQAQAGYLQEFSDPSFIKSLPKVGWDFGSYIPGTKRIFQITGDSMLPILSQSYMLTVKSAFEELIVDHTYVVITQNDILYKRLRAAGDLVELHPDNPLYPKQEIPADHILQYWKAIKVISDLPDKPSASIDQINQTIQDTNEKVTALTERWGRIGSVKV